MSGYQNRQHPQSRADTWSQYLQRRLQVVLVPLSEVLHRAGGIGSLHGRARLLQMLDVLDVRQFATTRVLLRLRPGEDDVRLELSQTRTHVGLGAQRESRRDETDLHDVADERLRALRQDGVPLGVGNERRRRQPEVPDRLGLPLIEHRRRQGQRGREIERCTRRAGQLAAHQTETCS